MRGAARVRGLAAVLLGAAAAGSCRESFEPLAPASVELSIFGYLDAAADTQWIRVTPVRPLIVTSDAPLEAVVTLEEMGTGRMLTLRDSVFRFDPDPALGSDGAFTHNFWTAGRLRPGEHYRLTVAPPDAARAEAEVLLPEPFDASVLITHDPSKRGLLLVDGAPHLPFAILRTTAYDRCSPRFSRNFLGRDDPNPEARRISLNVDLELDALDRCEPLVIERQDILLVSSGAPWPTSARFDPSSLNVPDVPSNIVNAIGFLGGIYKRTVPYEDCTLEPPGLEGCLLRYGPEMATVRGEVIDILCTRAALPGVLVELEELGPPSREGRRTRPVRSFRSGEYEIGALDAGRAYELRASLRLGLEEYERFHTHIDTLTLAAGETRTYDIPLRRVGCPPR